MLHRTRAEGRRQRGNGSESWPLGALGLLGGPRAENPARASRSAIASGVSATARPAHLARAFGTLRHVNRKHMPKKPRPRLAAHRARVEPRLSLHLPEQQWLLNSWCLQHRPPPFEARTHELPHHNKRRALGRNRPQYSPRPRAGAGSGWRARHVPSRCLARARPVRTSVHAPAYAAIASWAASPPLERGRVEALRHAHQLRPRARQA